MTTPLLLGIAASFLPAQSPATPATSLTGSATRCKASDLIGLAITNSKDESLGEIEDIVLDGGNRNIAYAVVGFGGFLGMGEKYFAMPWRLIEVGQRSGDDKPRATLGLDQETLKAAPGFDKSKWPDMANATWARQVDDYYRSRNENARPKGAVEPKGTGVDGQRGVDREPASKGFSHRRLSKLIGMGVVDAQRAGLADIEDLIVDTKDASIDGALLSFGGILGMGEKLVLIPIEVLTLDADKDVFVLPTTKARLEAMALTDGKMPALNNDEWLVRSREQCAKAREDRVITDGDVVIADASGVTPVPFADTYDVKKLETVKGTIVTLGAIRVGDVKEERIRLRVRTVEGREVIVYAAPTSCEPQAALALRSGKVIEVTGSPARYGTQTVLVAGSIVADGKTATLRDEQGRATWIKR